MKPARKHADPFLKGDTRVDEEGLAAAVRQATDWVRLRLGPAPRLAVVLGSGFGGVAEAMERTAEVAYAEVPGMMAPQVSGHAGRWIAGTLEGVPVWCLAGRLHYYEGHALARVTLPMRVLAAAGVTTVLLTQAAGGLAPRHRPGDFLAVTDHINLLGDHPLRGVRLPEREAFVDLTEVYDAGLRRQLRQAAREAGVRLHTGVYVAVSGPSYETPAEIRAFRRLGADAVGMSLVPEAIVARQCGLRLAALACITNRAAGLGRRPLSHAEVLAVGQQVEQRSVALVRAWVGGGGRRRHEGEGREENE